MNFWKKTKLENCNPDLISFFTFRNTASKCKIISFYDGDTCDIIIEYKKELIKLKCRLNGIDTPELRSNNEIEKLASIRIKNYLSSLYENQILNVKIFDFDKYGRILIELFDNDGKSINQHLINTGMAYFYDGKTKKPFNEWYNFNIF
jgi:endonuclease YncB( thermonuclease family)